MDQENFVKDTLTEFSAFPQSPSVISKGKKQL